MARAMCRGKNRRGRLCGNPADRGAHYCRAHRHQDPAFRRSGDRPVQQLSRWVRGVSSAVGSALALFGLWNLIPAVAIEPAEAMRREFVLSTPFVVRNSGLQPLEDVTFTCHIDEIQYSGRPGPVWMHGYSDRRPLPPVPTIRGLKTVNKSTRTRRLPRGESKTELCQFPAELNPIEAHKADITLEVTARPAWTAWVPFGPFRDSSHLSRFVLLEAESGRVRWVSQPLADRPPVPPPVTIEF